MEEYYLNSNKKKLRELSVEKIKLAEKPVIKKYLKEFFQNPKNYFNTKFGNKEIIIGKTKTIMERYEIPIPKKFQRRFAHRHKTKTFRLNNQTLSEQISLFNEKRKGLKQNIQNIDSPLKEGQRYINDREIEKMFQAFEQVQEINKNKINDFITTKELIDSIYEYPDDNKIKNKKNETNEFKGRKNHKLFTTKSSNLNTIDIIKNKKAGIMSYENKKFINQNIKNKKPNSRIKSSYSQYDMKYNKNILIPKLNLHNNKVSFGNEDFLFKNNNDIYDNNSTLNSQQTLLYKTKQNFFSKQYSNENIQLNEDKKKYKKKLKKLLLENEKLFEKQNQYLPDTKQELIKNEMAKRLARQEKALMYNIKTKNEENNLIDNLSKKLKKQKSALMLGQIEDYRLIKDIKIKINRLIKKTTPGLNYRWEMDLRNSKNDNEDDKPKMINNEKIEHKKLSLSQNDEITRNPCYNTFYSTNKKFRKQDKEYIKSKVSNTLYNKFMNDVKNLKHNYEGFLIEGKNLLKCEHELIKKIKGKKIINKYDHILQVQDLNDEIYADNFRNLQFNKS